MSDSFLITMNINQKVVNFIFASKMILLHLNKIKTNEIYNKQNIYFISEKITYICLHNSQRCTCETGSYK
jgi:hypothetical protein